MKTRRVLVLAACMVFLTAGMAQAALVNIGGSYSNLGGGSFTGATFNETNSGIAGMHSVPWMYCLSYGITISANTTYNANVNTAGVFAGTNSDHIAWLLTNYGSYISPSNINTNNTTDAHALQAALWNLAFGYDASSQLTAAENALYATMVTAASAQSGDVSKFYWITPLDAAGNALQPLISPVPIPAAAYLFGSGLAGLVGIARFRRKRSK